MALKRINNMADADYRAIELPSVTQIARRALSASAYEYWQSPPVEETASMRLGSLFDAMVTKTGLEKFKLAEKSSRSKAYKEELELAKENNITLVSQEEWDKATAMSQSFLSHPFINEIYPHLEFQISYIDEERGIKGRVDALQSDGLDLVLWDIKTTSHPDKFYYTVKDLGYDIQLAAYMSFSKTHEGGWLVIDSNPPHEVYIYRIKQSTFESALTKFEKFLALFHEEQGNAQMRLQRVTEEKYI